MLGTGLGGHTAPVVNTLAVLACPVGMALMMWMMRECQAHCQGTTASIDHMMTTMSQAQQSNDPTQMREALEQAQKPLATMKDHMAQCMNMMSMMQQMQGGMGGHMQKKK